MSIAAMTWAFALELRPASLKFLLIALADNADDEGRAFPAIETLCAKTSLDRKTVISGLDKLEQLGLISDTGKRVGRTGRVKVYRLPDFRTNGAKNGTVRDGADNGTVRGKQTGPNFPNNSAVFPSNGSTFPAEQSQKRHPESSLNRQEPSGTGRSARAKRSPDTATRLPDGFELTEARRQVALTERIDPDREFANFCDHFRSASGQRARKHDWDAAWRVWCRRAPDMQPPRVRGARVADTEEVKLRRLMDNRGKCAWLQGFRDPNPAESADEYCRAQEAEFKRYQREHQGTPRFVTDLAASKRLS